MPIRRFLRRREGNIKARISWYWCLKFGIYHNTDGAFRSHSDVNNNSQVATRNLQHFLIRLQSESW